MSRSRILQERLGFLGYDEHCRENLKELQSLLEPAFDDLLDEFYQFMLERPETRDLLPNQDVAIRARKAQKEHWIELLFADALGQRHCERALQIGRVHERIGLTLSNYLGGYCIVLNRFVDLVAAKYPNDGQGLGDKIKSIQKAVFLDIDFVIDSYVEAKNSAIRKILQLAEQFIAEIEQIDSELAGTGHRLGTEVENLSEGLTQCATQLARLREILPENEGASYRSAELAQLQAALATCEENAKLIGETSGFLTQRLDRLSTAVSDRKSRQRIHAPALRPEGFPARLKQAAKILFPARPS